ncbi:putative DNA binding domain-containing protein [Simiduia sp. 21SJ11W-1]|uniref:ATP-binding protein n=1 Tax=Simiduia sp. 21SJ11W-1 TaxID=2909669 RepID=UPI00209E54A2|nr:RNA-binding domain-containing protein [Simiduia sp. 21SJ11W-1]UTA47458.1 putative DNA binding domain-containing protein [Simiduia sp. 21SJ11W-1]
MIEIRSQADIADLRESVDVECKLAQGRDGNGHCPTSIWSTYSAFANTDGGEIFLGLEEAKDGSYKLAGIINTDKVLDEIWTGLNNPDHANANILRPQDVQVITIDGVNLIHIHVPRANRRQRPIYVGRNPLAGTYRRFNSADVKQPEQIVRRILAEQLDDSRDGGVLQHYGIDDLDEQTLANYRQRYANLQPDHPWNKLETEGFLRNIGAMRRDRETGHAGLTTAGLLMFGKLYAIKEALPYYMLDYQERPDAKTEPRWIDRVTLDGSWPGNLFDFYQRVIRKLTADLKIPFALKGDARQEDTHLHTALREALVNTLVHADFSGRASVLVVRRPDMFGFRNPGKMRVPIEIATKGGESDCRNRLLQDMFRYVGLGENAGSGLPKIFDGWASQHWRKPLLRELDEPNEQTILELHTISLIPEGAFEALRENIGEDIFSSLSDTERLILITAQVEHTVSHRRLMEILDIHPHDLTSQLSRLVEKNLLFQEGSGRGTIYFLLEARLEDAFNELNAKTTQGESSRGLENRSGGLSESSGGLQALQKIAAPVASTKRCPKQLVEETIIKLCSVTPLSLPTLTDLLNRSQEVVRKDYLQPMIKDRRLKYRYPTRLNHPDQAYIANDAIEH